MRGLEVPKSIESVSTTVIVLLAGSVIVRHTDRHTLPFKSLESPATKARFRAVRWLRGLLYISEWSFHAESPLYKYMLFCMKGLQKKYVFAHGEQNAVQWFNQTDN